MMEFFERYKKIILLAGFLLLTIILGYFIYALFFKSVLTPAEITGQPKATTTGSGLPAANTGTGQVVGNQEPELLPGQPRPQTGAIPNDTAQGGLTQIQELTNLPTIGATVGAGGQEVQYYNQTDGKFYRLDQNGNAVPLTDKVFHQVNNVVWAPNKTEAILEYPDGSNIIYNFSTNKQISLPAHWKDFSYSPGGDRIIMKSMGDDPSNRWLAVVSSDGTQVRGIESLGDKDATVYPAWSPNNQMVAMYTEGIDFDRQDVYFVGLNGENFKSTVIDGRGFQPKWQPEGKQLLYSVYSTATALKPELWLVDAEGDQIGNNRKRLNLQTWADKCSFASATDLYCAVPNSLDEGAGVFPELGQTTIDRLYRIDLATGAKKLIAIPDGNFTIKNISLSADQKNLYFNDNNSGKLYKVKLK
jgi:hypothetical protein